MTLPSFSARREAMVDSGAVRRAGNRPSAEIIGLIGVVVAFFGIGTMFALQQPPFLEADEIAHLAYAHEVASFDLPEVTTGVRAPADRTQWRAEWESRQDPRYRRVWVANHPPLNYVISAPLIWLADASDRADGGLLFLRFQNLALASVGIALTFFLASEVTGNRRVGLLASAIVALIPQGHTLFSRGLNDGLAFAVGTGLIWAAIRCVRRPVTRRNDLLLAAFAAAACGSRTATMLLAVVLVGVVAFHRLIATRGSPTSRLRAAAVVSLIGLGPGAVLFGWFYVRNVALYGDIGGSSFLLRYFNREPNGGFVDVITSGQRWVSIYRRMTTTSPLASDVPRFAAHVAWIAAAGLAIAIVVAACRRTRGTGRSIAVALIAVAVITATVVQHVAGGGNGFARYFFPVLGVLGMLMAIGFDRLVPRIGPLVLVGAMTWWAMRQMPLSVDPAMMRRPRDRPWRAPLALQILPGSDGARRLAALLMIVGGVAVVAALLAMSLPGRSSRRESTLDGSPALEPS